MLHTSNVDDFVETLENEIRTKELSILDCEFLAAVESDSVTRSQIGAWAKAFYAATRNGRLLLGNFYANSPDDPELRRELAENLYEEETGRISGVGRCHMDVFEDLLAAFGIAARDARALASPFGTQAPEGSAISSDDFYVQLTAYGLAVESPNAEFCAKMHRALNDRYEFTPSQLTWFSMHATLDADHGEEFRKYAARAAEHRDGLERVRRATLDMCAATKSVWDGGGSWQELKTS
jgi:pyrroloquinoline quinone (PQQ) biosynthesis protein C